MEILDLRLQNLEGPKNTLLSEAILKFVESVKIIQPIRADGMKDMNEDVEESGVEVEKEDEAGSGIDETEVKQAINNLSCVITEAASAFSPSPTEDKEDTSPVPPKKAKRDNRRDPNRVVEVLESECDIRNSQLLADLRAQLNAAEITWQRSKALFEWQDGPLVTAMKEGDMFVLDEINLAEDAVIERLNSVLESGREITLAEKGGLTASSEKIIAHPNFKFLATMNPGGDFGKRELSPALRSRFTEMWIPSTNSGDDVALIVAEILQLDDACGTSSAELSRAMVGFMGWLNTQSALLTVKGVQVSVREVLAWAKFVSSWQPHTMGEAYAGLLHGAHMVLLDGMGIGLSIPRELVRELKRKAVQHLLDECHESVRDYVYASVYPQNAGNSEISSRATVTSTGQFTLGGVGFATPMGPNYDPKIGLKDHSNYILTAKSVTENMRRILRAMQLPRPILLEGPPGVGKTSLISNLAKLSGHNLVRINLSEHSEISDLLGSDLPAPLEYEQSESKKSKGKSTSSGPKFVWCDGVFLTALKKGDWVLLDELNLAPQSVLEGLNACLDHRGEVFLPEIGQSFFCPPSFRVFCAQNPAGEGGGRKGLPQSFLTRFSRVFVEEMDERDVREIAMQAYSNDSTDENGLIDGNSDNDNSSKGDDDDVQKSENIININVERAVTALSSSSENSLVLHFLPQMVQYTRRLQRDIVDHRLYGNAGSPWEFNLRDIFRWCELVQSNSKALTVGTTPSGHVVTPHDRHVLADAAYMLFFSRLRTRSDREGASKAFADVFGWTPLPDHYPSMQVVGDSVLIGLALLPRSLLSSRARGQGMGYNGEEGPNGYQSNPLLLAGLQKVLETLAHCVSLKWPALMIGPSGSGKRRCLRQLALTTGNYLSEFAATSSTDSTELLGSFEQASAYRHLRFGLEHLAQAAAPLYSTLEVHSTDAQNTVRIAKTTLHLLLKTQTEAEEVVVNASLRLKAGEELFSSLLSTLQAVSEAISMLCQDVTLQKIARNVRVDDVLTNLAESRACFNKCYFDCNFDSTSASATGAGVSGFEWVDGVVVQAVKNGYWLLIDNVNLCSASVLDRLNSLLEPGGTLLLTESGAGTILTPHPNFRVFFSMDPSHGEISRAMRNRCVEVSMLVEGDVEVASAFLLSQVRTSNAPLLTIEIDGGIDTEEGMTRKKSEALLSPLCSIYERLSVADGIETDSPALDNQWDLKGSLMTAGISTATFPRFRMFARLLRLISIESKAGLTPKDALECSLKSVLPFLSMASSSGGAVDLNEVDVEGEIEKRVRCMSVDDAMICTSDRCPLQTILSSSSIQLLDNDTRSSLVLLVMLLGSPIGSNRRPLHSDWLHAASQSVRDRIARDLAGFAFESDIDVAAVKKSTRSEEDIKRAQRDSDGTAIITALHILAEVQCDITSMSSETVDVLQGFAMSLLVRSAMVQLDSVASAVSSLLIEADCHTHAENFNNWMRTIKSSQLTSLSAAVTESIVVGDGDEERDCLSVLALLQRGRASSAASLSAGVVAFSLDITTSALQFGSTYTDLMDVSLFDRWLTLDMERIQRQEVDDSAALSSDTSLSSLFALAYALHGRRIVADSSELQVLLSVHAALLVTDVVLSKITDELSLSSPLKKRTSKGCVLTTRSMTCLKDLLSMRDMLSRVLCHDASSTNGAVGVGKIPWEDVIVCVRWIKKSISALMNSVETRTSSSADKIESRVEEERFIKICASAHADLSKFDRALGEYWNRPILLDSSAASASSKLRLWKEGGHAAVPYKIADWDTLHALRKIVHPIKRTLPSFVETQIETVPVAYEPTSKCSSAMKREWLYLYSTFYWTHTNESDSSDQAGKSGLAPKSVDVTALSAALQLEFDAKIGTPTLAISAVENQYANSNESEVYGDADYPLLADVTAANQVREEWRRAGELSACLLLEPSIIASLMSVSESLASFLAVHSTHIMQTSTSLIDSEGRESYTVSKIPQRIPLNISTQDLLTLSSQLSVLIGLAVRYTLFDVTDFRELQTLLWSTEAVSACRKECSSDALRKEYSSTVLPKKKSKKGSEKDRELDKESALHQSEDSLLILARTFSVQFEVRLQSLLSKNLIGCMDAVAFTYSSPTLKAILEPSVSEGQNGNLESLVSSSVQVPWFWTVSTGILRLLQPSGLETALRHVDARALYSHSIAGAGSVSALTGGGAVVTVATCGNALLRLLQLFRLSVAGAVPVYPPQVARLELLTQHAVDVLTSVRDFLHPEGFSAIVRIVHDTRTNSSSSCSMCRSLLNLHVSEMSHSAYVTDILKRCLEPVLSLLSDQNVWISPSDFISSVGTAWVHIGLLRLYFTLPQTPIDPATKSEVKARLLNTEIQLNKKHMLAVHLQAVLSAKPPVTKDMAVLAVSVRNSERRVVVLSARAVQRPLNAPLFEELFSELRGASDGLADIERILDLISRTSSAFNALQLACQQWMDASRVHHTGKGGKEQTAALENAQINATTAFDSLTVCAREELGWQGSVSSFTDRCSAQFSAYEDVTSPILAAMHNLSSGMRLTVGWCYGKAEDLILALKQSQSSRKPSSLIHKTAGMYSASGALSRGWRDVLVYPHSSSIKLSGSSGNSVSTEALSQIHSLLQYSDLLAARAFKSISDIRAAQGESSLKNKTKIAPNPLLIDKICPQATLLLSLAKLDYLIGGGTAECVTAKDLFRQVLERFVHAYLKAEDDRKKQAALKAALYQNKADEKIFESDDAKEELIALRLHFPDHLSEFRDITDQAKGPDGELYSQLRDDDDEGEERKDKESEDKEKEDEAEENELSLSVDPQTAALLVGYHYRMVFLHNTQQLTTCGILWSNSAQRPTTNVHISQREALDLSLTSCSLMTAKGLEWGLRRLLAPSLEGELRGGALNAISFMAEKCNSSSWTAAQQSTTGCASWLERLSGIVTEKETKKGKRKGRGKGKKSVETAAMSAVSAIDRDLLLLLDSSAEGPWHPKDFNADPHPEEVMLAAEPLRKLFDRATEVLQQFPGNELLVQVCRVAARISELHTSTPVGKLLMTVQLLLVKAQEWEQYAAKHVSLHEEMGGLSVLIGRWRDLELKSWGQLLRCKEQKYVQTAMMYWFSLARSLNSPVDIEAANVDVSAKSEEVDRRRREVWPMLADMSPGWLCAGFVSTEEETKSTSLFDSAVDAPIETETKTQTIGWAQRDITDFVTIHTAAPIDPKTGSIYGDVDGTAAHKKVFAKKFLNEIPKSDKMTESSYLLSIFDILNSFLKRSVVGEFPTRLHLVRLFALQLHQDSLPTAHAKSKDTNSIDSIDMKIDGDIANKESTKTPPEQSLKTRLARVVMGVWRYYQQFLPAVRKFQDLLRGPIERRLKGEVKIGKWDQLSTYGLLDHSERVHKKLNKVRQMMITLLCSH